MSFNIKNIQKQNFSVWKPSKNNVFQMNNSFRFETSIVFISGIVLYAIRFIRLQSRVKVLRETVILIASEKSFLLNYHRCGPSYVIALHE